MQTKSQQNGGSVGPPPLVHMPKTASPHRPITGIAWYYDLVMLLCIRPIVLSRLCVMLSLVDT